ncbi:branched-chain amino acid ABC transporter permease [Xylanimonas protaetiae]|uniref:Branched-chain amino acid ABC transporter permease n=1 Tax=Xylanimonas protaetiae TaxID=2509457 RepID=A0A4P6FC24_9MICO|nr:branched-chain amino acid ABC transporter permease [Xylanimonas protaetiae]
MPWVAALVRALVGALLAAVVLVGGACAAQAASAPPQPGADQEKTDFYVAGTITYQDTPVPDAAVSISGGGFEAETLTGADGRWRLYVPEKGTYVITVDESTLPEGVILDESALPDGIIQGGDPASRQVTFGLTSSTIANLFLGQGERQTVSFWDQLLSAVVSGLEFGLLLALASIGAALIFGTTRLTNFAQAEMVTWGALVTLAVSVTWHLPLWVGVAAAVVGGGLLGWGMDAVVWRPLRKKGVGIVPLMIVSIGLSLAIRYVFQFFIGGDTMQLPGASPTPMQLGPIRLSSIDLVSMGVSLVLLVGVALFLTRTRIGRASRAISDNPQLAAASGIPVDRVIRIVWVISGVLAAVAGILWAYFRPGVKWDMGGQMLLLIFSAVVLGGLGTAFGALLGALIIGVAVEISPVLGLPVDLKYAAALVVLIVILLVRPQGLLGRRERLG